MTNARKRHSAEFRAKIALEAAKEIRTLDELASQYGIHPGQISQWKKQLLDAMPSLFAKSRDRAVDMTREIDDLYRQIGQVTVERDWRKKKLQKYP